MSRSFRSRSLRSLRFLRYLGVGAVATAVHYALLAGLVEWARWPPHWAAAAGAWVGAQVAFVGNARVTFGTPMTLTGWWRFQFVALVGAVLSWAVVRGGVALGSHYLAAQVVATALAVVATFELTRRWTFASTTGR